MNLTRKLGIAATLAGVITVGCGLAMTPRALAAPQGYAMSAKHKGFQYDRYANWDHRGAWDHRGGWDHRARWDHRGFGPEHQGFVRHPDLRDRHYVRDHHRDRHGYFDHRHFHHYWR